MVTYCSGGAGGALRSQMLWRTQLVSLEQEDSAPLFQCFRLLYTFLVPSFLCPTTNPIRKGYLFRLLSTHWVYPDWIIVFL